MQWWPRVSFRRRGSALALWAATLLFIFQVGLHAATPEGMTLPRLLDVMMDGGGPMAQQMDAGSPADRPGAPGSPPAHTHPEGLCCMPPLALAPGFWTPPAPTLARQEASRVRAAREALLILRATARGPPLN